MVFNKPLFITDRRRKIAKNQLRLLLQYNVIELIFERRTWPLRAQQMKRHRFGTPTPVRRILCTSDWKYLEEHSREFEYKRPRGRNGRSDRYYRQRNLAIVYDIIIKKFRMVNLNDYKIMNSYPLETDKDRDDFMLKYEEMFKRIGNNNLLRKLNK